MVKVFGLSLWLGRLMLTHNGSELCVRAGYEAQSFNLLLKFHRSTKLKFARQP